MPRGGLSRGVPARLACLLLLALVAAVCLTTGADARRPKACPTNDGSNPAFPAGTPDCNACLKKDCKYAPAIVSATGVGGKAGKRARCLGSSAPQPNNTTVPCSCRNKRGGVAKKRCRFCVPNTPLVPCINGTNCPKDPGLGPDGPNPLPPPSPPSPPAAPPPPPTGPAFLPNNVMIMQAGAVKYTPTNPNGNWTVLCQIPQAAKAIDAGASVKTVSGVVEP